MAKKSNKETKGKDKELLDRIKDDFSTAEDFYSKDYKRNKEDTDFALGNQWDATVKKNRNKFKQPCLTENHLLPFALKTVNEIRKSRPAIRVLPVDDEGDVDTAEIYGGIIRNIQYASKANNLFDSTALNAIMSARGFLKVGTRYVSEDSFEQEIILSCAEDPFKCYLDPSSKALDGSDANWYIEYENMTKEAFKKAFPGESYDDAKKDESSDGWVSENTVRVVDYYYKNFETKTLYQFVSNGELVTDYELPEGVKAEETRETSVCTIKHCRVTGDKILQKTDVVGGNLPVVPVYGFAIFKDGKREVYSLIHQAKDPQRMLNYWKSASAEIVALQPKSPWIGPKGTFINDPEEWAKANIENISFLEYEPVIAENGQIMPPPQRATVPQGSAIMVQEGMIAADGIKSTLGIFESAIGQQGNEISGVAIEQRQLQGDNATYHFVDNLVASMQQVGRIMVDMIPEVYSEKRVMRIMGEDDESRLVGVNQPVAPSGVDMLPVESMQEQVAEDRVAKYDLETGKYDVVVDIGSSYATRRKETFALMKELMNTLPQVAQAAPDLLIKSFDVQYSDEIAKRVRNVMDPALLAEDADAERVVQLGKMLEEKSVELEKAKIALEVKQENAQAKTAIALRELKIKELEADTKAVKTQAEVEKLRAETRIEIPAEARKDNADAFKTLEGQVKEIQEAFGLLLSKEEAKMAEESAVETPIKRNQPDG